MATIAVYSAKGGVGKTTLAVNLAWCAATLSRRRTLLWDLDAQGASSYMLANDRAGKHLVRTLIEEGGTVDRLIRPTSVERLDLLPADESLRSLDATFAMVDRRKRLRKLIDQVARDYDRIILDCPPGLGDTSGQILRSAAIAVVPVIPSALSWRSFESLRAEIDLHHKGKPLLLPVFNMVDKRRSIHRQVLDQATDWPVIPMASVMEKMSERRAPIGSYAPNSPAARAIRTLWERIESVIMQAPALA